MVKSLPTLLEEFSVWQSHQTILVAGVDEAGRGAWAGPLVAAAAILPLPNSQEQSQWEALATQLTGVNDSKQLTHAARERLFTLVCQVAQVGVGIVSSLTIDYLGVGAANRLAWLKAIAALPLAPHYLLLDAFKLPEIVLPQKAIIHGDTLSLSIAAASIVAKVTRDRLMQQLDKQYPQYGFATHKGYGTAHHATTLKEFSPSPIHRYSYAPVWAASQRLSPDLTPNPFPNKEGE